MWPCGGGGAAAAPRDGTVSPRHEQSRLMQARLRTSGMNQRIGRR